MKHIVRWAVMMVTSLALPGAWGQTGADAVAVPPDLRVPEAYSPAFGTLGEYADQDFWHAQVQADRNNTGHQLQYYMAIRQENLLQNNGHLPEQAKQELERVANELATNASGSFEDHLVQYQQKFPSDDAFDHLDQARSVSGTRPELLPASLAQAQVRDDKQAIASLSKELFRQRRVSQALLAYATDLLNGVETNAVLVVAGEMDGIPALATQHTTSLRNDVTLIDHRLLANARYRAIAWEQAGGTAQPPSDRQRFLELLPGNTDRPVFFALSLPPQVLRSLGDRLYPTGLAALYSITPVHNAPLLEKNWSTAVGKTKPSHLQANYLLPGALLLEHHRLNGNQQQEQRLELELGNIARSSGKEDQLQHALDR